MKNLVSLVVGKKGTGKTTLCRDLIKRYKGPVFIVDYLGEYLDLRSDKVRVVLWSGYKSFWSICKEAWEYPRGSRLLVLDEIEFYCLDYNQKEIIEFLYRLGRHRSLDIIAVSHRFFMIPVLVRAMTDRFFVFRITEPRDLKFLDGLLSKDKVERVKSLPVGRYIKVEV